jgi:hypothetical protein
MPESLPTNHISFRNRLLFTILTAASLAGLMVLTTWNFQLHFFGPSGQCRNPAHPHSLG